MKNTLAWLMAWSLGFVALGQVYYDLPNVARYDSTNIIFAAIDFDGDAQVDATYHLDASFQGGTQSSVATFFLDDVTSYLASAKNLATFSSGEKISTANKPFKNSFGFFGFNFDDYAWAKFYDTGAFGGGAPHYAYARLSGSEFPTLTDVLVGLRFLGGDGKPHHAWVRLTRPDNNLGTLFQVASYGYNPLPDEPIKAGQPAPPPAVTTSVEAVSGSFVFSWPEKTVAYYKLQARPDLDPATEWTDVDTGDGHTYTAAQGSEQAYYRLVQR